MFGMALIWSVRSAIWHNKQDVATEKGVELMSGEIAFLVSMGCVATVAVAIWPKIFGTPAARSSALEQGVRPRGREPGVGVSDHRSGGACSYSIIEAKSAAKLQT